MIQQLKAAAAAAFILAIGACNSGAKEQKPPAENTNPQTTEAPPVKKMPVQATVNDEVLQAVYLKYLDVSKDLTDGDLTGARLSSNALEAGAVRLSEGGKLASLAANITVASSLEGQRLHFAALSNEMVRLVKKAGLQEGAIYVDYCPMALNDKGAYWLSGEKGIRNPYFGEQMLTCGEVKETLQ
ncbi:MAG TPA: DUF3347 domain-containing protein [Flavisolibacter sp.]|nr:DUF3347 domain-containing protein [Flavisolibacter sp.]